MEHGISIYKFNIGSNLCMEQIHVCHMKYKTKKLWACSVFFANCRVAPRVVLRGELARVAKFNTSNVELAVA